jgi:hypothetical protein
MEAVDKTICRRLARVLARVTTIVLWTHDGGLMEDSLTPWDHEVPDEDTKIDGGHDGEDSP